MNLSSVFSSVLAMSLTGSIIAILIFIVKLLFKNKFSTKWHYYIWILLLLRLFIPYDPPQAFNLYNIFSSKGPAAALIQVPESLPDYILPAPDAKEPAQKQPIADDFILDNGDNNTEQKDIVYSSPNEKAGIKPDINLLGIIWVTGVLLFLLAAIMIYIRMNLIIRKKALCKDQRIIDTFNKCKKEMGVKTDILIIIDSRKISPFLFGALRPKLIISSDVLRELSSEELRYIFLHELSHLKANDILMLWAITFVQALHWFNPIIWYAFHCMRQDCEIACDSVVLSKITQKESTKYGQTIINLLKTFSYTRPIPGATGIASNSQVKRRIIMISKFGKKSLRMSVTSMLTIMLIAVFSLQLGCTINTSQKLQVGANQQTPTAKGDNNPNDSKINVLEEYNKIIAKDNSTLEAASFLNKNISSASREDASIMIVKFEELQKKYLPVLEDKYYKGNSIQEKMMAAYKPNFDINSIEDTKDPELKSLLTETRDSGFKVETAEGMFFPIINYEFNKKFSSYATDDIKEYISLMAVESGKVPAKDAALMIPWEEVLNRALAQEAFINKFGSSVKVNDMKDLYKKYVTFALYGLNNTPLFDYQNKEMVPAAKAAYTNLAAGSEGFVKIIKDYLEVIKKNNYKLTEEVEAFRKNIKIN